MEKLIRFAANWKLGSRGEGGRDKKEIEDKRPTREEFSEERKAGRPRFEDDQELGLRRNNPATFINTKSGFSAYSNQMTRGRTSFFVLLLSITIHDGVTVYHGRRVSLPSVDD